MFFRLFLLFTLVPLIELLLLIRVGMRIGTGATILLVVGTGVVGAFLARREGVRAFHRVQAEVAAGRLPTTALVDALLVLVAGVLLVTPGILTDLVGLGLLLPAVRAGIRSRLRRSMARRFQIEAGEPEAGEPEVGAMGGETPFGADGAIDAEFQVRRPPGV